MDFFKESFVSRVRVREISCESFTGNIVLDAEVALDIEQLQRETPPAVNVESFEQVIGEKVIESAGQTIVRLGLDNFIGSKQELCFTAGNIPVSCKFPVGTISVNGVASS